MRWIVVAWLAFAMTMLAASLADANMGGDARGGDTVDVWHVEKRHYRCAGTGDYVLCHSDPRINRDGAYRVMVDAKRVWVSYKGQLIYQCWTKRQPFECQEIP